MVRYYINVPKNVNPIRRNRILLKFNISFPDGRIEGCSHIPIKWFTGTRKLRVGMPTTSWIGIVFRIFPLEEDRRKYTEELQDLRLLQNPKSRGK